METFKNSKNELNEVVGQDLINKQKRLTGTHENVNETERNKKTESFLGLANGRLFSDHVNDLYKGVLNEENIKQRQKLFESRGVTLSPTCVPANFSFDRLNEADWGDIKKSEIPEITLWSAGNYYRLLDDFKYQAERRGVLRCQDLNLRFRKELDVKALLRSLPLVHGTSFSALEKIFENQKIISNKALYLIGGKSALDFHTEGQGYTTIMDRALGLDEYVFADFGRPHSYHQQQEITIVIDPNILFTEPGVFMTEKDILDCHSERPLSEYLHGSLTPEHFYDAAILKIGKCKTEETEVRDQGMIRHYANYNTVNSFSEGQDEQLYTNIGKMTGFSTWEVKLPAVPVSAIKKLIFQNQEHLHSFIGQHPDCTIETLLDSDIASSQFNSLKISGEFEKQLNILRSSVPKVPLPEGFNDYSIIDDSELKVFMNDHGNVKRGLDYITLIDFEGYFLGDSFYPTEGRFGVKTKSGPIAGEVKYASFDKVILQTAHENIVIPFKVLVDDKGQPLTEFSF